MNNKMVLFKVKICTENSKIYNYNFIFKAIKIWKHLKSKLLKIIIFKILKKILIFENSLSTVFCKAF